MTDQNETIINLPGLKPIPVVAIKLPDGTIALRHPSEIQKLPPQPKL